MESPFLYLRTLLIIKRKQFLNLFRAEEKAFVKFAIVCTPRSGSTWLHTLFNSHPQIISYGEKLRETYEAHPSRKLPSLDEIIFHPHHFSIQAVGLKLFYEYEKDSVFQNSFRELVEDKTIYIIHLIRKDKTAQFKSLKRAEATQRWSSGKPQHQYSPIEINLLELAQYQKNFLEGEVHIDGLFQHHAVLKIKYEDLLSNQENTLTTIQNFLNVKQRRLFSLLKKQSV